MLQYYESVYVHCTLWVQLLLQFYCHTYFSMGDLGLQVSVHPSVFPSTFTLGVLWAQLLLQFCTDHFETLHMFFTLYEDVHVVWI